MATGNMGMAGVLCKVCGDRASGKHYGVPSCDGCRGFFKRSIRRNLDYTCKEGGKCIVDVSRRNQCQACRFAKCLQVNMRREAVQHERAPRNCGSNHGLLHSTAFSSELYPISDISIPPPNLFLPFAPLPSFCFTNYGDIGRFSSTYPSPSIWDPLNLTGTYLPAPPLISATTSGMNPIRMGIHNEGLRSDSSTVNPIIGSINSSPIRPKSSNEEEIVEVTSSEEPTETISKMLIPNNSQMPPLSSRELLNESATKLLFLALKWIKTVPSFTQLPIVDQKLLIEDSWAELFVLTAAQWGLPLEISHTSKDLIIRNLQNAIQNFQRLRIDQKEAACLKALVLFKSNIIELASYQQCLLLQEQTLTLLHKNSIGGIRFGHLLMLLIHVKNAASSQGLYETFFKKTLGENGMEKVLEDIIKNN